MSNSRSVRAALILAFSVAASGCGSSGAGAPFGASAPLALAGLAGMATTLSVGGFTDEAGIGAQALLVRTQDQPLIDLA
jgi:hypothetical protein